MKRIIALFAVFALVFCLTFVPVKAEGTAWSLPFSKIETLLDIAQQLFSGAEVNLAEISNQALGLYDFILDYEYYLNENGIYVPTLSMSQADALRIGLSSLALNGENELTALSDLTIPIKAEDIAHFINYNADWVKRYNANEDVIVVAPDEDYLTYLENINGTGFWFSAYSNVNADNASINALTYYPPTLTSWFSIPSQNISLSPSTSYVQTSDIFDIRIYSLNGVYTFDKTINADAILDNFIAPWTPYNSYSHGYINGNTQKFGVNGQSAAVTLNYSYTGNLEDVLSYVQNHFRNVNIYVDGVAWSLAGGNVNNDALIQLGAVALGDLGKTTFPVYTLDQEGDLGLDVGAFANWLDGVIRSGATAISLGDVIADGIAIVDTETGERVVTDDDAEDVTKVIAGVKVTTAPAPSGSPTPSPTPKPVNPIIPPLKIIPPLLDPALRPSDIPRQTTVLSEIIDATNKTVPQDIMILFWSTIGLLVVGGLIYIMHK